MSREIMQQALDALRRVGEYGDIYRYKNTEQSPYTQIYEAIDAINVELAKPEPKLTNAGAETNISRGLEPKGSGMVTLNQREWVELTDTEINKIVDLNTSDDGGFDIWCDGLAVARIVCAKLKELNK